jgi:hypothetical protein
MSREQLTIEMAIHVTGFQRRGRDEEVVSAAAAGSKDVFVACSAAVLFLGSRGDAQPSLLPNLQASEKRLFHQVVAICFVLSPRCLSRAPPSWVRVCDCFHRCDLPAPCSSAPAVIPLFSCQCCGKEQPEAKTGTRT